MILGGAGWFLFHDVAGQPQAAVATPPPTVGVQPGCRRASARASISSAASRPWRGPAARPGRGLPRPGAVPRGPPRQARPPAVPDREGPVPGRGRSHQGRSRRDEAKETNAQLQYDRRPRPGVAQHRSQSLVDLNRAKLENARAARARPGRAFAGPGQPRLYRHSFTDRRPHRPHPPTPSAIWSIPPAACWPSSSAMPRSTSCSRSACASCTTSASRRGEDNAPSSGTWNFSRSTRRSADRQFDHPRHDAQSRRGAGRRRVRHRGDPREGRRSTRLVVPQAALQVDQSGYYALIVDEQHKVVQRRVTSARSGSGRRRAVRPARAGEQR